MSGSTHKRHLRHAIIVVAIAFAIVVCSSWIIAWSWPRASMIDMGMVGVPAYPDQWIAPVPGDWPATPLSSAYSANGYIKPHNAARHPRMTIAQGMFLGVYSSNTGVGFDDDEPEHVIERIQIGWPVHVFQQRGPRDARPIPNNVIGQLYSKGIPVPELSWIGLKPDRRLPIQPFWWRFIAMVVVVAIIVELMWRLITLRSRLRRRYRIKHALCLQCGYAIEEQVVCPECGATRVMIDDHAARSSPKR